MRGAFLAVILSYLFMLGFSYPFVAVLAYVWIDIVKPQVLAYNIITNIPVALIAAVIALMSYLIRSDKKNGARFTPVMGLMIFFAAWITFTTANADPHIDSWHKWDWAFKAVIFSAFIPLVIRTRVHIEAFLLTMLLSIATISFATGVKTALGGGGYGVLGIMGVANSGLSESSTLAAVCVMQLPLMHYLYDHSVIFPRSRLFKAGIIGLAIVTMFTIVGTGARTGLVAAGVLLLLYVLRSRHKLKFAIVLAIAFGIFQQMDLSDTAWGRRMSSIGTYNEDSSASGRIEVWKWTMDYAAGHPLGGGFDAFRLNRIANVSPLGIHYHDAELYRGTAFHNVFFEVMGEQGLVGFGVYMAMLILTFLKLRQVRKRCKGDPDLVWCYDLATKLRDALAIILFGGMFIGIAYQCYILYLIVLTVSLGQLALVARSSVQSPASYAKKYQ